MIFRQYELSCLSLFSYLIGDETTGRAVVVDPQRDIGQYLADADADGLTIERVIETHFHADFLSGHLELAAATGAAITYGVRGKGKAEFPVEWAVDGQRYSLGEVTLEVLATPGHTPESICVVVYEHGGDPPFGVLTGDTLFIGDVGRPDLLGGFGLAPQDMARDLFSSLHTKLLPLPDATSVYPAHGAGSACGRAMLSLPVSTIGEQRASNYALQPMSEADFVAAVVIEQPSVPQYFPYDAVRNRQLHELFDESGRTPALGLDEAVAASGNGAVLLDTRDAVDFAAGHLRGALNVGLEGRFAEYTGGVVAPGTRIVLLGAESSHVEATTRLARIGFDTVIGHLPQYLAAMASRPDLVVGSSRLTATEFADRIGTTRGLQIVDVRNRGEVTSGTIPGAKVIPLPELAARLGELDPAAPVVVVCATGRRSSTAASLLAARGFADTSDLIGGMAAWSGGGR